MGSTSFRESLRYLKANLSLLSEADRAFIAGILAKSVVTEDEVRRVEDIAEQLEARTAW